MGLLEELCQAEQDRVQMPAGLSCADHVHVEIGEVPGMRSQCIRERDSLLDVASDRLDEGLERG